MLGWTVVCIFWLGGLGVPQCGSVATHTARMDLCWLRLCLGIGETVGAAFPIGICETTWGGRGARCTCLGCLARMSCCLFRFAILPWGGELADDLSGRRVTSEEGSVGFRGKLQQDLAIDLSLEPKLCIHCWQQGSPALPRTDLE